MRATRRVLASAILLALAAIPLLSGISGCAHHTQSTPIPATPLPDLQPVGLKQLWQRQVSLDPGERIKQAWRVGGSVFIATDQSRIARIDARSGVLAWSINLGEENFDIYKPIELRPTPDSPDREVLVVTRGNAFALDMLTGDSAKPPIRIGLSVSADPVIIGNTFCVGGAGSFIGLYVDRTASVHWRVTEPGDLFDSSPLPIGNSVVVASRRGKLWRVNSDTGDWIWKDRKTNGPVVANLAADARAVFVPCLDQRVYAFAVDNGGELWEQQISGTLDVTPAIGGSVVMVVGSGHGIYGLSRENGDIKWEIPGVSQIATVGETAAWVGDVEGNLKSVSIETGQVISTAPAQGVQLFVRNTEDKSVILVTRAGLVGLYTGK